jgi:hypothetical protein
VISKSVDAGAIFDRLRGAMSAAERLRASGTCGAVVHRRVSAETLFTRDYAYSPGLYTAAVFEGTFYSQSGAYASGAFPGSEAFCGVGRHARSPMLRAGLALAEQELPSVLARRSGAALFCD